MNCEPVMLKDIEISGGGKSGGLLIFNSNNKVAMDASLSTTLSGHHIWAISRSMRNWMDRERA